MDLKSQMEAIHTAHGASKRGVKEGAKAFAEEIAARLKVRPEEVAILLLNATGNTLLFVWPPPLFDAGAAFPAGHKNAFASAVLTGMKGKVDNRIAESKHLKFFESVKGLEQGKSPIQKMVALPLVAGDKKLGVVEVSRKGKTAQEAGPSFTPEDAQILVELCREAAPLLDRLIPEPFF